MNIIFRLGFFASFALILLVKHLPPMDPRVGTLLVLGAVWTVGAEILDRLPKKDKL